MRAKKSDKGYKIDVIFLAKCLSSTGKWNAHSIFGYSLDWFVNFLYHAPTVNNDFHRGPCVNKGKIIDLCKIGMMRACLFLSIFT